MKIRNGFVSNSSSASFICKHCHQEYEIENRCGVDDDWVPPEDGLCEECLNTLFICKCGEIKEKKKSVKICEFVDVYDEGYEVYTENICLQNSHVCPKCFIMFSDFHEKLEEWTKKVANPKHKLTAIDKKIIEAATAHGLKVRTK